MKYTLVLSTQFSLLLVLVVSSLSIDPCLNVCQCGFIVFACLPNSYSKSMIIVLLKKKIKYRINILYPNHRL